jgi:hypothetical protein
MTDFIKEMVECAKEARTNVPAGKFRICVIDKFDYTGGEVALADTIEAAIAYAQKLVDPANMQGATVYNDKGECVWSK